MLEAGARANLCFHDISTDESVIYTVPRAYLRAVADGLRQLGIARSVRFYFDDGYASAPGALELMRRDYPEIQVVLALTVAFLDQPGFINSEEVPQLHRAGAAISAHGREHLHMEELDEDEIKTQLEASRAAFSAYGGDEFVLPFGTYDQRVVAVNRDHRLFSHLTTVDYAWDTGQELRPRLMVTSESTPAEICARLERPD